MSEDVTLQSRREVVSRLLGLGTLGAATAGLGIWLRDRSRRPEQLAAGSLHRSFTVPPDPSLPEMVVARAEDPAALVRKAIDPLGGIRRFVSPGETVVVKPNIAWDRAPEQAANTNPQVVAEVVRLCREAGAAKVIVTDVSTNEARRVYQRSGIAEAARSAGAEVILPEERRFREVNLKGDILQTWPVFEPFLTADRIINVPIAKQHSLTGVTLGMKNWYGILGGQRHRLHQSIHETLADLAEFMRPTLTIIDAYRVLIRNGPVGGSLGDVELHKTLIAGTDPVALDAYAALTFWDLDSDRLRYLRIAEERHLGTRDLQKVRTKVIEDGQG
jgi:uncharacterized protein (DUF362 family)